MLQTKELLGGKAKAKSHVVTLLLWVPLRHIEHVNLLNNVLCPRAYQTHLIPKALHI